MRNIYFLSFIVLCACSSTPPVCAPAKSKSVVYVIGQSWHAEVAIPVEELGKDLKFYKDMFPGARVIMFGYGKKTFFTAPAQSASDYILGPIPGPAAIQVVGLNTTPENAYDSNNVVKLNLPPGGSEALSKFIWRDLEKDEEGKPQLISYSHNPDGLFYLAESEYSLKHTCNTWAAKALGAAKLPVSSRRVVFSGQVMKQAGKLAEQQCQPAEE